MTLAPTAYARLYTPVQVGVASFLGAPLAAGWLMARNYRALQEKKKEKQCLIYTGLGTAAVVALAFLLPDSVPNMALPIGYTIGIYQIAKQAQGPLITEHQTRGGSIGSWWSTVGIGLLGLVAVLAVIVLIVLLLPPDV